MSTSDQDAQTRWRAAMDELPATPDNIPVFFFSHGSPILAYPESQQSGMAPYLGSGGPLAGFLKDFGPMLLQKYQPKGIVVFSAHWETERERLVTDYGDHNPLLMDYYGFPPELYQLKFDSKGDSALSARVVELFREAGMKARVTAKSEARGMDGRGFEGPGLDHGVFVPFRLMFGEVFREIPIVEVSIDSSLSPETNWDIGHAMQKLRHEGILVLSGGLLIHNLRDRACFAPTTARTLHKEFDEAILEAVGIAEGEERRRQLVDLTRHGGFRACHPREEHFVPLFVAAGGGGAEGRVRVLCDLYGIGCFVFGL